MAMTRHRSEWLRWGQIVGKTTSERAMLEVKIHESWRLEAMIILRIPASVERREYRAELRALGSSAPDRGEAKRGRQSQDTKRGTV